MVIVDTGTFTDAAIELGVSQAAVSRNLMALERVLGVRLLHRTSRNVTPTTAGVRVLAQARQILAAADNLVTEVTTGHATAPYRSRLVGHGPAHPGVPAPLGRQVSRHRPAPGPHTPASGTRFATAIVGYERRCCALAADDPWARRRSIRLDEVPQRTLLIDPRTGTTTPNLWPRASQPRIRETRDIDDWLAIIAAGGGIGITPEGTTAQYRRDGVVFRPLRDAPPIAVQMIWRRHDPHPSTHAAVALLTELYHRPS